VAYLALVSTLFGYGQWSRLLSRHPANVVAPYALLLPFFAVLFSALVLGERLSFWQLAGGSILVLGLALHVFGPRLAALWRKLEPRPMCWDRTGRHGARRDNDSKSSGPTDPRSMPPGRSPRDPPTGCRRCASCAPHP
jgi:hypothetical protein